MSEMLPFSEMVTMCPHCGYIADAHTDVESRVGDAPIIPQAGDHSLCIDCGGLSEYDERGRLSALGPEDDLSEEELTLSALIKTRGRLNS